MKKLYIYLTILVLTSCIEPSNKELEIQSFLDKAKDSVILVDNITVKFNSYSTGDVYYCKVDLIDGRVNTLANSIPFGKDRFIYFESEIDKLLQSDKDSVLKSLDSIRFSFFEGNHEFELFTRYKEDGFKANLPAAWLE